VRSTGRRIQGVANESCPHLHSRSACVRAHIRSGFGRRLSGTERGRLGRARLPLSHRRSHARAAPALQDGRQSVGRTCVDPAWHRRLRSEFLDARLRGRVVRPWPAAGRKQILHHSVRRAWNRKIGEAIGWPANQISEVQLRRHGRSPIPTCDRGPRHPSLAPRARQFHGRYAHVALGRKVSRLHGCAGAHGVATPRPWRAAIGCCGG